MNDDSTIKKSSFRLNVRFYENNHTQKQAAEILEAKGGQARDFVAEAVVFYNESLKQHSQLMIANSMLVPPQLKPHYPGNTTQQTSPSNPPSDVAESPLPDGASLASPPISPTSIEQGNNTGSINEDTIDNVLDALKKWDNDD